MQFLVSLKNSEPWQQIVDRCQLTPLNKIDGLNVPHTEALDTTAYCIRSALTLGDISQLLANKGNQLVLSLDAPESLVGKLLQQGKSLSDAVAIWHQQTTAVLKLRQQHRRQLQLAQADGLLNNPAQAPEWLASRFSVNAEAPPRLSHDLYSLMASQALRQNHEAESTWQSLIACSLPLLDNPYLIFDLDALHQAAILQKDQQLAERKEENESLQQELFQVQEELEQMFSKNQTQVEEHQMLVRALQDDVIRLTAKLKTSEQTVSAGKQQQIQLSSQRDDLKTQFAAIQSELEKASRANKDSEQQLAESRVDNELLLQQLFQVQEELEQMFLKNQTLSEEHQILEQTRQDEVADLTDKLRASEQAVSAGKRKQNQLQSQHNELITQLNASQAQLENASRARKNTEQQLSESKSENELILQQLFYVQEELEQYAHKLRQLENESKHQQTQHQRILTKLERKLKIAAAEEINTKHHLAAAQSELKAISASKLWKSVAPMRKLTKAISAKNRIREQLKQDVALIMTSDYFDITWYLQSYPDVAESGMNPAEHYLCFGADEGRAPGPLFDSNWYLSQYPDVAESSINPLLHYVKFGAQEGRTASPKLLQHQKGAN